MKEKMELKNNILIISIPIIALAHIIQDGDYYVHTHLKQYNTDPKI